MENRPTVPNILLYGPPFGDAGGGAGGYTRNMQTYLRSFACDGVRIEPLFHTVRGQRSGPWGSFPARMAADCWRITKALIGKRPDAVHALATYRAALPREVYLVLLCRLLGVKLIYDVKAGAFIRSYEEGHFLYRTAMALVLRLAGLVLVEGKVYQAFLKERLAIESVFFPNFMPTEDVPAELPCRLKEDALSLLFVGHCYEGKGSRTLLEGCALAARSGVACDLTLIGEEEPSFSAFADRFDPPASMTVRRLGRRPHRDVLAAMAEHDIFCYPSAHPGEGHSNAINEAMSHGMVIIASRQGFSGDVLGEDGAYFLDSGTADDLAPLILTIAHDRDGARAKASRARARLLAEFTSKQAIERLRTAYAGLFAPVATPAPRSNVHPIRR